MENDKAIMRAIQNNVSSMIGRGRFAMILNKSAAFAAFSIVLISVSCSALAQGAPPAKKPTVRGKTMFQTAIEDLVSKHRGRPYRAGHSPHWVKVKNREHPAMERVMDTFS
jgi:hypothetical protein